VSALPVDPAVEPVLDVARAGALFGLGRSKSYLEARRYIDTDGAEGLPAIAFGRTLRCPTQRVLEMLGLDATDGHPTDRTAAVNTDIGDTAPDVQPSM
jgi:hypothetical protein